MDFLILGPLEVRSDGRALDLGGAKQRAVLAVLLLRVGDVVSIERLIDELWGERPPASAAKLVQGYVSGLRRLVGGVIRTQPPGYALEINPENVDAHRFEQLARDGRPHDALALWRGRALEDVVLEGPAAREASRLDELRLVVAEARIDADLASGRHAELVPELERLAADHPLRERFHAQLMLALYRSQRQAEALEAYRRAHRSLRGELGLDPGRELHFAYPSRALVQVDLLRRRIEGVIPLAHVPWKVAFGEGYVWVSTGTPLLLRVDPDTREVKEISLGVYTPQSTGEPIAVGFGAVWVAVRR